MIKHSVQIRVRYGETDQMGIVYYGNYASYFEVGRVELMRHIGVVYKDLELNGVILPVVNFSAQYWRPAKYDDLLTITTQIRELPTSYFIHFNQEVYQDGGRLLTKGKVTCYFLDTKTKARMAIPTNVLSKIKPYFESTDSK